MLPYSDFTFGTILGCGCWIYTNNIIHSDNYVVYIGGNLIITAKDCGGVLSTHSFLINFFELEL